MGSISVIKTRAPYARKDSAHYASKKDRSEPTVIGLINRTYAFTNVAEASNDGDLTGKHDVGRTLDTIDEGFAATIVVVKLGFGDGVIDVDSWDFQSSLAECLV